MSPNPINHTFLEVDKPFRPRNMQPLLLGQKVFLEPREKNVITNYGNSTGQAFRAKLLDFEEKHTHTNAKTFYNEKVFLINNDVITTSIT